MSYTATVITVSDSSANGQREDLSGPVVRQILEDHGFEVAYTTIVPDDIDEIARVLKISSGEKYVDLAVTTGGTGLSPKDVTPEATLSVIHREVKGIPEAMRWASFQITPRGCLSRGVAGIRNRTLIVNLPGSPKAAKENLEAVIDALGHGIDMLHSNGSANCAK